MVGTPLIMTKTNDLGHTSYTIYYWPWAKLHDHLYKNKLFAITQNQDSPFTMDLEKLTSRDEIQRIVIEKGAFRINKLLRYYI